MDPPIVTLVVPELSTLDAALQGDETLSAAIDGAEVAEGWNGFAGALTRTRDAVAEDPARTRWGTRLFLVDETLVGWGGFKGPPADGTVELGYEVAPGFRGRGIAGAAVREMLEAAFSDSRVRAVTAHTLAEPGASTRVLEKTGFSRAGEAFDEDLGLVWRWRHDRPGQA